MRTKDSLRLSYPNILLAAEKIFNVRRSDGMNDVLGLSVGIDTTQDQLERLEEYLVDYIKAKECRGLQPTIIMSTTGIYDKKN